MLDRYTLDLHPVERGCGTIGGLGLRRYYGVLPSILGQEGSPVMVAQGGLRTRSPNPARSANVSPLDSLETVGRLTAKVALMRGTLERLSIRLRLDDVGFDISFDYGMLRVSYNCKLKIEEEDEHRILVMKRSWNDSYDLGPWNSMLFLEQLNNIYDTLQYDGAKNVTFAAFRLRGTAKNLWLRIFEARVLRNQLWTWDDFQEEFKQEYIPDTEEYKTRQVVKGLRMELQNVLAPLPPMSFAATVEAATRIEIANQMAKQREQRVLHPNPTNDLDKDCGKVGHLARQCPGGQPTILGTSRGVGRPPNAVGAPVNGNNKPQVKAKVYTLDGQPLDG
ncbi:hypothetical protein M9H77_07834 [Catharanthus roseus]|uniref:Uncharacterized protein n=1 Tax=Catharanthus roseus TaxID=4058 RepID=A0ACC0BW93_CATRO|nr:hypothetical protein M9H77_07834 [Catharanthus roseus]